jgi:soluble lytic murein transglycosylase
VAWVTGAAALTVAVIIAMPDAKKLYNDLTLPLSYQDVIRQQAAADHLDPALVAGVIDTESKFDPSTSSAGAVGLMQLLPSTAEFLARRTNGYQFKASDLQNPQVNITYGCYYLRFLLDEFNGNVTEALAAYNGGETNVGRWIARARADGHAFGVGDIRFPETRAYVEAVLAKRRDYRQTYPTELGYR